MNGTRRQPAGRSGFLGGRGEGRLRWIIAAYLAVVAGIIGYTTTAIGHERDSALIVNVASRQRALAERYVKDVMLVVEGYPADSVADAAQLRMNAEALLLGGEVVAVRGADEEIVIPPASQDPVVVAKLETERELIEELIDIGDTLMLMIPSGPTFENQVLELRIAGGLLTSVSNDAVGAMTQRSQAAVRRLVTLGAGLGAFGAVVAVGMGLLMRRAGARRTAQFRSLVHQASDLITVVDTDGRILYQSPSSERLMGVSPDALVGTRLDELVLAEDRGLLDGILTEAAADPRSPVTGGFRVRHADGTTRDVDAVVSNLLADPTVRGLVLNTRDVTERTRLEAELERRALFDSLTNLPNRAVFRDRLDHALARTARRPETLAVLLLDLDEFKLVNDSLGHDAGDELLVVLSGRIQGCARSSDTVARLGGDEFAILLEDAVSEESALAFADRVLAALKQPFEVRGREVFVGASVGIVLDDGSGAQPDDLIRNADTAMYAAKAEGKGKCAIFRPAMHERTLEVFEVQADLQHALIRGELVLHYQPIVDFRTGRIEGLEALVRWNHPTRGLVMPGAFIPVAEETGMIVPLGVWVLGEACRQTAEWRARLGGAGDVWVSVNLSTRQLLEIDLIDRVAEVLRESTLDPSALVLEITEGALMQDVEQTSFKLHALKALGARLALDDFGTGSSSLGHLRRFPIDVLKIDKSFVDGVAEPDSEGAALVRAILELARTLHMSTVAEGIELVEQHEQLAAAGCDWAQGYLFARPMPPGPLEEILREGRSLLPLDSTVG
jgi:diguanylate cyclase (GGDEF)-like protein/PAS domain S-box-containing protein